MKRKNSLFSFNPNNFSKCEICFMPKSGERSKFAVFISNRRDIDPNGVLDIIAHGNETLIEIENN